MGISEKAIERLSDWPRARIAQSLNRSIALLLFCFILSSCTSIRPVIKIGLLAPFEGLQRRSGYVALTAMRQAIADSAPATVAIMPLALDSGADPAGVERAARKLLQDDAVRAIVGPYSPLLMQELTSIVAATDLPWLFPFAINPTDGFVTPNELSDWMLPLLQAAAEVAAALGSQRLVLAGWPPGWPQLTATQAQTLFALPVRLDESVTAVEATDALFWLGSAEEGAVYLMALRAHLPTVPFLVGPHVDAPIFSEQTQISGPVYLLSWEDDGYDQWRTRYADQPPTAYLTYRATQTAIAWSLGQPSSKNGAWRVKTIALVGDPVQ